MEENEEEKRRNLEIKFEANKNTLPPDFRQTLERFFELVRYFRRQKQFIDEIAPLLEKLMHLHYPDFKAITNEVQIKWMEEHNKINAMQLFGQLNRNLKYQRNMVPVSEKYPKIEQWREFYCKSHEPDYLDEEYRKKYPGFYGRMSDAEWQQTMDSENKKIKQFHEWEEKRKNEYYELVQPVLFQHLPELQDMEGDWWVIYAVSIRDNYETWNQLCEELETALDYDLPPESCNWEYDKFKEAVSKRTKGQYTAAEKKRNKKIYGEG